MPLTLKIRTDYTLEDLLAISKTAPVVKTPHVGNNSLNNLFAAKCQFPLVWVDTTIPKRDKNANPHLLITGGESRLISSERDLGNRLTTHVKVTETSLEHAGFVPGASIIDGHLAQMRNVFPATEIETAHDRFARHGDSTDTILRIATNVYPQAWYRTVDEQGRLQTIPKGESNNIDCWSQVRESYFCSSRDSGWVIPNTFAILHDIIVQHLESKVPYVYMLSGPDMVSYLPELMPVLETCYQALRQELTLPADLTINLIPFTYFRFVVRKEQAAACAKLVAASGPCMDSAVIRRYAAECSDLFTTTESRSYFNQHDMKSPDDVYVPEELFTTSLFALEERYQSIKRVLA